MTRYFHVILGIATSATLMAAGPAAAANSATLRLEFDQPCYKPGQQATVLLWIENLDTPASGYQAFLEFDSTRLTFVSGSYTAVPFGQPIITPIVASGDDINLAAGIDLLLGDAPTTDDAVVAMLTFVVTADEDCEADDLVRFRPHFPPTRVTNNIGEEILPLALIDAPAITVDETAPNVVQGSIASCYPDVASAEAAAIAATSATDNCTDAGDLVRTVTTVGTCNATVTVTYTDCAGNSASAVYNTRIDATPPAITCPAGVTVQCIDDVPPPATTLAAFIGQGGSVSVACGTPTFVHVGDSPLSGTSCNGSLTRTYRVIDECGRQADCTQTITIKDTTPPVLSCPLTSATYCSVPADPASTGTATAVDNCDPNPVVTYSDLITGLGVLPSPGGWTFFAENTALGNLVSGPAVPPAGVGSFRLLTGNGTGPGLGGKGYLKTSQYDGLPLAAITQLKYSTYVSPSSGAAGHLAPSINLYVDLDNNGTRDTTLVFEPVYVPGQGAVTAGVWQTWDALTSENGWWYTANFGALTSSAAEYRPLSYYIALYPNAKIVSWGGDFGFQIVVGQSSGGIWANFDGNVDRLIVNADVHDFEPGDIAIRCGAIRRTWTATDACGNSSSCPQFIAVIDPTPPTLSCPADIVVNADPGGCTATVDPGVATATDNCEPNPIVVGVRDDGQPLDAPYPQGETTITWTAYDQCGNSSSCQQRITVNPFSELRVSVELQGAGFPASMERCITFELSDCGGDTPKATVDATLTFVNGLASDAVILVPCGNYTCITARDRLHTLRRTDDDDFGVTPIIGGQYVADFTNKAPFGDDDSLIGGNLDDSDSIDIMDFAHLVLNSATTYSSPHTDCSTPAIHVDLNGDGLVFTEDFTFIQINFFQSHEPDCCELLFRSAAPLPNGPKLRVTFEDLAAMGRPELATADLNGDKVLDQADIVAWLQGARPGSPLPQPATPARRR